jgi:REP element-mobilizing transposase RayT
MFENRRDVEFFLDRIGETAARDWLEVHAYCVLTTHFHLLVRSPRGAMACAMRHIQLAYTTRFNRTRDRDGPLARGRYRSKLVDSHHYRRVVVGYIDDNAVQAGLARTADAYAFASCRAYVSGAGPEWLSRWWVQREVCAITALPAYDGKRYPDVFQRGFNGVHRKLVERRLQRGVQGDDPVDSLLSNVPEPVTAWLRSRAQLADGTHPGLSLVTVETVRDTVRQANIRAPRDMGRHWRQTDWPAAVRAQLWRDLAGLTYAEIGAQQRCSPTKARESVARVRSALLEDAEFAERVAACAAQALAATYRGAFAGSTPAAN